MRVWVEPGFKAPFGTALYLLVRSRTENTAPGSPWFLLLLQKVAIIGIFYFILTPNPLGCVL